MSRDSARYELTPEDIEINKAGFYGYEGCAFLGFEGGCPTPFHCSERGDCPRPSRESATMPDNPAVRAVAEWMEQRDPDGRRLSTPVDAESLLAALASSQEVREWLVDVVRTGLVGGLRQLPRGESQLLTAL